MRKPFQYGERVVNNSQYPNLDIYFKDGSGKVLGCIEKSKLKYAGQYFVTVLLSNGETMDFYASALKSKY
jgi:hypothetical protein